MWHKNQRVISDNEKELGLGTVEAIDSDNQTLHVFFPLTQEKRHYTLKNTPVRRFFLKKGQSFLKDSKEQVVTGIESLENLIRYTCQSGEIFWEYELPYDLSEAMSTLEKITQTISPYKAYDLRKQALMLKNELSADRLSGLVTSRVKLLPHQIYLANQISGEENPRVLLADEVGLGKTIEAGLIFSSLNVLEKANRVLIVTPNSLVHQWAQEMSESFQSLFTVMDKARYEEEAKGQELNPFESNPRVIISIDELLNNGMKAEEAIQASWDLLIVDEAHHLDWDEEDPSLDWRIINQISQNAQGLLLLTATPRLRGLSTQYGLLHMIDPKKFSSFEDFVIEMEILDQIASCAREIAESKSIPPSVQKQLELFFKGDHELLKILEQHESVDYEDILSKLIDRYGTGRLIYRNRKCNLSYFPKRNIVFKELHPSRTYLNALEQIDPSEIPQKVLMDFATGRKGEFFQSEKSLGEEDARILWLANYVKTTKEKTFVICASKQRVLEVGERLKEILQLAPSQAEQLFTLFHEDKSSFTRDQEAALFARDDSPNRLLIASELGGEGRNFQFLRNIILFDLPTTPEALEQRIGRLDRIGQGSQINIHIPYLRDTPEEVFLNWYHLGLDAFRSQNPSNGVILENLAESILENMTHFFKKHKKHSEKDKKLVELVKATQEEQKAVCEELEKTQDVLLDLNSFNEKKTQALIKTIEHHEDSVLLESFVLESLNYLGVDYEDYDQSGSFILQSEALSFVSDLGLFESVKEKVLTFDRNLYLSYPGSYFVSYPSSFVQTLLELATSEDQGRFTFCSMNDTSGKKKVYFQTLFSCSAKGPKSLELEKYLRPQCLEFLVDSKGSRLTDEALSGQFEAIKENSPYTLMLNNQKFISILTKTIEALEEEASHWVEGVVGESKKILEKKRNEKISHLKYLTRVNPMYTEKDLLFYENKYSQIASCLDESQINLESVRVILVNP